MLTGLQHLDSFLKLSVEMGLKHRLQQSSEIQKNVLLQIKLLLAIQMQT